MKKLIMAIVCLMTMISANAQNINEIKQGAVNFIKRTCKAPSTFILTDEYGNKISVNKINCFLEKGKITYDSVVISSDLIVDSVLYYKTGHANGRVLKSVKHVYNKKYGEDKESDVLIVDKNIFSNFKDYKYDSVVYSHYEAAEKAYVKRIYNNTYKIYFCYEAQNSYGGMIQNRALICYDLVTKEYYTGWDVVYTTKQISITKYETTKKPTKKIFGFFGVARTNYLYEKKHKEEHIDTGVFEYSCNLCFAEESDHRIKHEWNGLYLSTIDKCIYCKNESPELYHLSKYHKQLECLVCKEEHLTKHKKNKKGCEWCAQGK